MTIEQFQGASKILSAKMHHKANLDRLQELRENGNVFDILKYLATYAFYCDKVPLMILEMLDKEIEACEKVIEKYDKIFNEL